MNSTTDSHLIAHPVSQTFRSQIKQTPDLVHFNNAGISPMLNCAKKAMVELSEAMQLGFHGFFDALDKYEEARGTIAKLVGGQAAGVGMFHTTAAAISQIAFGFSLKAGDEIVRWDQEYASNVYPWHRAAERANAKVVVVKSEADFQVNTDALIEAITSNTKLVAISWIQSLTGAATDLKAVAHRCHEVGALLVVDAIQGLGVIPFDMQALEADIVMGGTYKWCCGPMGHGFLVMRPELLELFDPIMHGAISYDFPDCLIDPNKLPLKSTGHRFEPGAPLLTGGIVGGASIEALMSMGISNIHQAALATAQTFREGLAQRGFEVWQHSRTPHLPTSPITAFSHGSLPEKCLSDIASKLEEQKISHAQNKAGLRLAPHGFNNSEDVEKVWNAIDSVLI